MNDVEFDTNFTWNGTIEMVQPTFEQAYNKMYDFDIVERFCKGIDTWYFVVICVLLGVNVFIHKYIEWTDMKKEDYYKAYYYYMKYSRKILSLAFWYGVMIILSKMGIISRIAELIGL